MTKRRGKGRDEGLARTWRRRLARYRSSGLTVREFCKREEVPETSFYHWQRELAERDKVGTRCRSGSFGGQARRPRRTSPLFLPVRLKDGPSVVLGAVSLSDRGPVAPGDGVIELRLPSGHVLRGGAVEKLARLAALLDGSAC